MNQFHRIHAIWNPHVYHGWGRSKRFFEGWYYKIVNKSQTSAFAIIPGIAMDENGNKQSFIQVLDGINIEINKSGKCIYGALKELFENFTFQLLPKNFSMKPSMISKDIIASTIPMINTDQKAKRIMYSLSPSKKSAKIIIVNFFLFKKTI